MEEWVSSALNPRRGQLYAAYVFGSAVEGEAKPQDLDVAVIVNGGAGSEEWVAVRLLRDCLVPRFFDAFGIPLSMMVLTLREWKELDGVVVRKRRSV